MIVSSSKSRINTSSSAAGHAGSYAPILLFMGRTGPAAGTMTGNEQIVTFSIEWALELEGPATKVKTFASCMVFDRYADRIRSCRDALDLYDGRFCLSRLWANLHLTV